MSVNPETKDNWLGREKLPRSRPTSPSVPGNPFSISFSPHPNVICSIAKEDPFKAVKVNVSFATIPLV